MLTRHLTNKILDIRLEEEKFYFPGETIKGSVIVHSKSAIKVNSIQLKFSGQVYLHLKEKESNTLFQELMTLSVCPNSTSPKQTTLDTSEHTFPFKFIVPKNLNLPSSMEYGKKAHIRYTVHALLDRPMLPESLCPKVEYAVSLLEYIDIEKPQFKVPQEKSQDIMLPQAKYNQKCMAKASMPRLGFTRGDIVPLKVTVDHFTSFSRKNGVTVDLVRTVEIRTAKHTMFKEAVLRSTPYPIDLKEPNFNQSIVCQMLIPTSTPPSIRYKDRVLRFHYKVRVTVLFDEKFSSILDLPIVVGTWPRAAVPIEDDDDAFAHDIEDSVLTDEEEGDDDVDIESLKTCSIDESRASSNILPSWHTINSSTSTLTTAQRNSIISINDSYVGRSDSVASKASNRSHNSVSSWKSSRSWENNNHLHHHHYNHKNHSSNNLSRNTSQSTTVSSPDRLPSYGAYNINTPTTNSHNRSASMYSNDSFIYPNPPSNNNNNMNRNSNGINSHPQQVYYNPQQQQGFYHGQQSQSFYNNNQMFYNNGSRQSMVSLPPQMTPQQQNVNNINRLSRYNRNEEDLSAVLLEQDVPTHILEPLSTSGFVPLTSPIHEQQEADYSPYIQPTPISPNDSDSDDISSFDSDDDDLLAIIERKKRKEKRELKKKKQQAEATF